MLEYNLHVLEYNLHILEFNIQYLITNNLLLILKYHCNVNKSYIGFVKIKLK